MPSKSMNQIKKDKAFKTIAVFAMVFLFVASLIMAIVLPFVNTVGVADATSAPVYAEGVKGGAYIDFSGFQSVPFSELQKNTVVYGFYYDTSVLKANTFSSTFSLSMYDENGRVPLNNGVSIYFTPYSTAGIRPYVYMRLTFKPFIDSNVNADQDYVFMYRASSETLTPYTCYLLNGFYFGTPFTFGPNISRFTTYADFFSNWYAITSSVESEVVRLQQEKALLQQEKDALQSQYNDLLNSMDFSVFNSVNLDTAPVYNTNYKGDATQISINGQSYSGYWYRRRNVESGERRCITELNVGSTLLARSEIKCTYDALYKYNGDVPDNIYVGLAFTEYGVGAQYEESHFYQMFIPYSDWFNGSFIVSVPFDVNYIAFDLFDSNYNPLPLNYNINTGLAEGLFISNFVVSGRGSNFKTAIDNAHKQGYNSGYEQGFAQGKEKGYLQGSKDQGDYTFMGLIGAVFDAPISAFQGLLNFEVLGVDMSSFVLALFSLAVIVVIVKIALGGK